MSIYSQKQLEKYADALVWGLTTARKGFKKYDTVLVRCDLEGRELGEIVHRKLVQRKFNVIFRFLVSPKLERDFYEFSDEKQRGFKEPGGEGFYSGLNGNVYIHAPSSLTNLKGIDTKRQSQVAIARKYVRDIMTKNEEKGKFGWTLCTYPTEELARQAKLSLKEYAAQVAKACYINEPDPAKKWNQIYRDTMAIKNWLNALGIDTIRTESASMDFDSARSIRLLSRLMVIIVRTSA